MFDIQDMEIARGRVERKLDRVAEALHAAMKPPIPLLDDRHNENASFRYQRKSLERSSETIFTFSLVW